MMTSETPTDRLKQAPQGMRKNRPFHRDTKSRCRRIRGLLMFGLWLCVAVSSARAANRTWDNPGVGDWSTNTNWSDDTTPTSDDLALISNGGTAQLGTEDEGFYSNLYVGTSSNLAGGTISITGGELSGNYGYLSAHQTGGVGTVLVDGGTWNNAQALWVGYWGSNATLTITNEGLVSTFSGIVGNGNKSVTPSSDYFSSNNTAHVSGMNSVWDLDYLVIGAYGSDNTVLVDDGGLVIVSATSSDAIVIDYEAESFDNFIRLDGGFLAWQGNQTANIGNLVGDGQIQLWNGVAWVSLTGENFAFIESESQAEALTGYSGLGGYTIVSSQAVPEPTASALIVLGLGALLSRRGRNPANRRTA